MRRYLAVVTILSLASLAGAVPTYQHSVTDLGGGLYGHDFWVDNTGAAGSAWFVEMEWHGASQAEVDALCPGNLPGSKINQVLGGGFMVVHTEAMAITWDTNDPNYDMTEDTWIRDEFCNSFMNLTPTEGPNSYYVESGTQAGLAYVVVDHAYIVSDGSVAYSGRLGVGLVDPVWTNVSGASCIPEPATLLLLGVGAVGLAFRKRR